MDEKELLKKSGIGTSFILLFISLFWFLFSIQTSFGGYAGGPASGIDVGINSKATAQSNWQVGSSGVFVLRLGIENVTGSGSAGYMTGTNTYYPRIEWTPALGTFNFVGTGSYPVTLQMNGETIPSAGSVTGKIDAVGGTGTTNVFTDATLAGSTTIGTGSTITTGTSTFSGTKVGFLADVDAPIGTAISSKLTKVGTPTTYLNSVTVDGKTGTTSVSILNGSGINFTSVLNPDGSLEVTGDVSGSVSAKADIVVGTTTYPAATLVDFSDNDFTHYETDSTGVGLRLKAALSRTGTHTSLGTATDTISFGTTTQSGDAIVTIVGSGTSPIHINVVTPTSWSGTNTTALMTGFSAPSPNIVYQSSNETTYYAWKAFDKENNDTSSFWETNTESGLGQVTYNHGTDNTRVIITYEIAPITSAYAPNSWALKAGNDNVSWVGIDSRSGYGVGSWTALQYNQFTIGTNTTPYQFYRLDVTTGNNGTYLAISEINLISKAEAETIQSFTIASTGEVLVGTSAKYLGTSTYYPLQVNGKGLGEDWTLKPSGSWVKTDLPGNPITEALDIFRKSDAHKFLYKDKVVSDEVVETKAINDYIKEDEESEFVLFREVHQNEYIEGDRMEQDFKTIHRNNKVIEWNSAMVVDKANRLQLTKAYLEMDITESRNNTANYGVEIDRNCPDEILDKNGLPSASKWLGINYAATKGLIESVDDMKAELGSATVKNEELAEEIDNLYSLIEAIILGLVALGGVGGWTTIRRKRKGT